MPMQPYRARCTDCEYEKVYEDKPMTWSEPKQSAANGASSHEQKTDHEVIVEPVEEAEV